MPDIPRRPRGKAKKWTAEEIEAFIEEYDLEDADELAEESGRKTNSLWKAGVILAVIGAVARKAGESTTKWSTPKQRYITQPGSVVTRPEVRRAVKAVREATQQSVLRLADQFKAGKLTIGEFQTAVGSTLARGHIVTAGIAGGGRASVSAATRKTIAKIATPDLSALARLMKDVQTGKIPLAGRFNARLKLITRAVESTFYQAEQVARADAGYKYAKRKLGSAEHCQETDERPGCPELAAEGWVPIADMVPIGEAACYDNCQCDIVYATSKDDED